MDEEIQALRATLREAIAERDALRVRVETAEALLAATFTAAEVRDALENRLASWIAGEVMQHLALKKGTPP